jgi:sec-independent protein translocase protein TatA
MFDGLFQPTHIAIIVVVALLVFGPKKLPELGKGLGEGIKSFKKGIKEATESMKESASDDHHDPKV